MAHEQVAFVRYCRGFLVAVTMSTRVWMSVDACFYLIGDGMVELGLMESRHLEIDHRFILCD